MRFKKKQVELPVKTVIKETIYRIDLTYEEACALQGLVSAVSGSTGDKPNLRNVVTDEIANTLNKAGIDFFSKDVQKYTNQMSRRPRLSDGGVDESTFKD